MEAAQRLAGYSLGPGRHPAQGDGQEKSPSVLQKQQETFFAGMTRERLLGRRRQHALWNVLESVRRLRVQQGAHRRVRADLVLDGVPQGALSRRVHGRPAHQRRRREGQARGLPQRVPPHGHQGAAARRGRVHPLLRRRRRRHPLRSRRRAQRRCERRRRHRGRAGRRLVHVASTTSSPRCRCMSANKRTDRVADQGGRVRLARIALGAR